MKKIIDILKGDKLSYASKNIYDSRWEKFKDQMRWINWREVLKFIAFCIGIALFVILMALLAF